MATVSSHVLNGVEGTHAGAVAVTLCRRAPDGSLVTLFAAETDAGGRLVQDVDLYGADPVSVYEMVVATGPYWDARSLLRDGPQIMTEVVVRLAMPNPDGRYHIPLIISPNSYSVWWSS